MALKYWGVHACFGKLRKTMGTAYMHILGRSVDASKSTIGPRGI